MARPVRMLVDSGADVNTKHGRTQLTPLQMACSHAHPDVETIRSFLDKGNCLLLCKFFFLLKEINVFFFKIQSKIIIIIVAFVHMETRL